MDKTQREGAEEISDFAERVLFSGQLDDKLRAPRQLTDLKPRSAPGVETLSGPERGGALRLVRSGENRRTKRELRPRAGQIADPHLRARLLHTFAHHELISLELMALALLRYPDAPRAFRRGLAQVIIDEQRHFGLYQARVEALGSELGAEPVSDYFWRCVASAESLSEFNARLGLVFEQANIDFTRHYGPLFQDIGDHESAAALDVIYRDEISHVGFGLHWFRRWRPQNEPEWDSFCALLKPPLSPGRARGATFCEVGRRAAGMSEDYIEQLKRWGGSTGRPPVVWLGNIDVEDEWRDIAMDRARASKALDTDALKGLEQSDRSKSQRRKTRLYARRALAPLLGWVCTRGDVIVCPDGIPSEAFQEQLYQARGFNPQWVKDVSELDAVKLGGLRPWGISPQSAEQLSPLSDRLIPSGIHLPDAHQLSALAPTFTKSWDLLAREEVRRALIESDEPCPWYLPPLEHTHHIKRIEEISSTLEMIERSAIARWVVKAAWGNAGRGLLHIDQARSLSIPERGWLQRQAHWGCVVEPWLTRRADLSFQGTIDQGSVRYEGAVVNEVDHLGRFGGALLSPPSAALPVDLKRLLNGDGQDRRRLKRVGALVTKSIGTLLRRLGYQGAFGVDALIAELPERGLVLYPVVEVNPRYTMGRVALSLRQQLDPRGRHHARLKIYPPRAPRAQLLSRLRDDPAVWGARGVWSGGTLGVTDWWRELEVDRGAQETLRYGSGPVALVEALPR